MLQRNSLWLSLLPVLFIMLTPRAEWIQNSPWKASQLTSMTVFADNIFITSYYGGIYRFDETDAAWHLVNNGLGRTDMSAITHIGTTLFAGARFRDLYRSTDTAATWSEIGRGLILNTVAGNALARQTRFTFNCVPEILYGLIVVDSTLFACGCEGLFRSDNLGDNWIQITENGMDTVSFATVVALSGKLFAQPFIGPQLFLSTDGGLSWVEVDATVPFRGIRGVAESGTKGFVFTKTELYLTEDSAKTWKECATGTMLTDYELAGDNYFSSIIEMGGILFLGTIMGKTFKSIDSGTTWQVLKGLPNEGVSQLTRDNGTMYYLPTFGGPIYRSTDTGLTWSSLPITGISDIEIDYLGVDDHCMVGGEGGRVHISADNGENWQTIQQNFYPLTSSESIIVIRGPNYRILFSTDYGAVWNPVDSGISSDVRMEYAASNGTTIIGAFGSDVLRSTDKGTTWEKFTTGLDGKRIGALATDGTFFYAINSIDDKGVFRSSENSTEWTAAGSPSSEWVVYDIFTQNGRVVTYSKARTGAREINLSIDHGETWNDLTPNMPVRVDNLVSVAMRDSVLFVASSSYPSESDLQHAVYLSKDLGTSWTPVDSGLPRSEIRGMALNNTRLFVGTGGNGIWSRPLSDVVGIRDRTPRSFSGIKPASAAITVAHTATSSVLRLSVPRTQNVSLSLYNLSGKKVATLIERVLPAGIYSYSLDTEKLAKGCYSALLRSATGTEVRTIPVVR